MEGKGSSGIIEGKMRSAVNPFHIISHMTPSQLIDNLLKPMEKHTSEAQEQAEAVRLPVSCPFMMSRPFRLNPGGADQDSHLG